MKSVSALNWKQVAADLATGGAEINYIQHRLILDTSVSPLETCIQSIFRFPWLWEDGLETMRVLLRHRPDLNLQDAYGMTPLMVTLDNPQKLDFAMNCQGQTVREAMFDMLMEYQIEMDLELKDFWGLSALSRACICGDPHMIRRLVELGVNVNTLDDELNTPLHHLCTYYPATTAMDECIVWMVEVAGADINVQEEEGYTPWMYLAHQTRFAHERNYGNRYRVVKDMEGSLLFRLLQTGKVDLSIETRRKETVTAIVTPVVKAWFDSYNDFSYILK
jgi:ankyrin repeat protein